MRTVPLLSRGEAALAEVDAELGLAFDEQDKAFYMDLFVNKLGRDPTDVELFDLAQSNSEHSRHWFFGAKLLLDGVPTPETLMQVVKSTLKASPGNSVIGFHDNSSAIRGGPVAPLLPEVPGEPSAVAPRWGKVEGGGAGGGVGTVRSVRRCALRKAVCAVPARPPHPPAR